MPFSSIDTYNRADYGCTTTDSTWTVSAVGLRYRCGVSNWPQPGQLVPPTLVPRPDPDGVTQ